LNDSTAKVEDDSKGGEAKDDSEKSCPGAGSCDCTWALALPEAACAADDGSECFCRCCCDKMATSTCMLSPASQEKDNASDHDANTSTSISFKSGDQEAGNTVAAAANGTNSDTPDRECPGKGSCKCDWAAASTCAVDDGSECFCRCCCDKMEGSCKWSPSEKGNTTSAGKGEMGDRGSEEGEAEDEQADHDDETEDKVKTKGGGDDAAADVTEEEDEEEEEKDE